MFNRWSSFLSANEIFKNRTILIVKDDVVQKETDTIWLVKFKEMKEKVFKKERKNNKNEKFKIFRTILKKTCFQLNQRFLNKLF